MWIMKIKCFYPPWKLNEDWCIYSCLQIQPRENWFQYVRRVHATAINFPCIIIVQAMYCTFKGQSVYYSTRGWFLIISIFIKAGKGISIKKTEDSKHNFSWSFPFIERDVRLTMVLLKLGLIMNARDNFLFESRLL